MIVYPQNFLGPNRQYLSTFFVKGKHLVLTDSWLNENKISDIKNFSDIDHVLIDLSHNPVDCKKFETIDLPVPYTILANDFNYFFHPMDKVCWFPVFFYIWNQKNPLWYHNIDFETDCQQKKYQISCLNSTPSFHRLVLFNQLKGLLSKNIIVWSMQRLHHASSGDAWSRLTLEEKEWILSLGDQQQELTYDIPDIGISSDAFGKTALNIVTETSICYGFLSEKICKPLASLQFFMLLASPGATQLMQHLGFDIFDDVIMHGRWDNEIDTRKKISSLAKYLQLVLEFDWIKLNHDMKDRLIMNQKHLFSQDFEQLILQQIQDRARYYR